VIVIASKSIPGTNVKTDSFLRVAVVISMIAIAGCASSSPPKADVERSPDADLARFQTASIQVVDADTGLPLAGVRISHGGDHLYSPRDYSFKYIRSLEFVTTDGNGDARLQPLENGDRIRFSLTHVDAQSVFFGYYASGNVRNGSLDLQNPIIRWHEVRQVEQQVALDPQQVPVVPIDHSFGGPPDPPAQQCLRELRELKPAMREADAEKLLKNHGFYQKPEPPAAPNSMSAASKSISNFDRWVIYLNDRHPQRELYLILHEESHSGHYRLNEWYINNLDTGTRTEDADVLRQAWPKY
jgi:hypothetical protein